MRGQELWETGIKAKNTTLFKKVTDWEDGRLMSQNNHFVGCGCLVLLQNTDGERGKKKKEKEKAH